MSENAKEKTYGTLIKEAEDTIRKLQTCDDVDQALELFELATENLNNCELRIEAAKGKFEKILCSQVPLE